MSGTVHRDTPFGRVEVTWTRVGRMIEVRYGDRVRKEVASDDDQVNDFTAGTVLDAWIAADMKDD